MSLSFNLPAVRQGPSVPLDDVEWIKINQAQRRIDFYGARLAGHHYTIYYLATQNEIFQKDLLEISHQLTTNSRSWLAFKAGSRLTAVNVARLRLLIHWKPQRQIYFNAQICNSIHEDNRKVQQMYETIKNRFSQFHESHCIAVDTPTKEFCFCPSSCSEIEVDETQRSMKYKSSIFQNGSWSGRVDPNLSIEDFRKIAKLGLFSHWIPKGAYTENSPVRVYQNPDFPIPKSRIP
ncbi:MAG: hypothetical protein LLG04_18765 [Parachlamydia sp.]|nr:hypothetical protein [Parachlamydia sp.]